MTRSTYRSEALEQELKIWEKYIFNNMPIIGLNLKVLCTYTEAFYIPFKFKNRLIVSYNIPMRNLYVRQAYWADADKLFNEGITDSRYIAVGEFPEKFVMDTAANVEKIASKYHAVHVTNLPIGKTTGNYYIDIYGYCWFEMENNFLNINRDAKTSWVRETAIDYPGKDKLQSEIAKNRDLVLAMRAGQETGTSKSTKSKLFGFLSVVSLLLSK